MRIYLDACCLSRPFDDQRQDRIRLEAEAVLIILQRIADGEWSGIGSEVLDLEIEQTPDAERRMQVDGLASLMRRRVRLDRAVVARAHALEELGFRAFDALHLASAEKVGPDVFLTTDDKLLRRASRLSDQLQIAVRNPLTWLNEVLGQ